MDILKSIWTSILGLPKNVLLTIGGVIAAVILFLIFQTAASNCYYSAKNRYWPEQAAQQPKVDYKLDRDWSTCIFRRLQLVQKDGNAMTGAEMIAQCDQAFTVKK